MHRLKSLCFLVTLLLLLQACASSESPMQDGSLDCTGLSRIGGTGLGALCLQEGAAGEFREALLDGIEYGFRPVSTLSGSPYGGRQAGTRYPIGPQQKRELERLSEQAFLDALAGLNLTPASEPGAGVLGVRGQILDVSLEAPEDTDSGAKYLFDRIGRATVVVELYDSATDEVLLRAFDHGATERPTADVQAAESPSQMAAIAGFWRAVLSEALGRLPE
jgi:hypothetical protein